MTVSRSDVHRLASTPLFVYGWLLPGSPARGKLEPHVARTEQATARAADLAGWPARIADGHIEGQLLWIVPDHASEVERQLKKLEGSGFGLEGVTASSTSIGTVTAVAFRWRGPRRDLAEYLAAADRKIAIAEHELRSLVSRLNGELPIEAPIPIQADFEGVIYAVDAAVDQVIEALQLGKRSNAAGVGAFHNCLGATSRWLDNPLLADVVEVRNDATHAYYDKRPMHGLWQVVAVRRGNNDEKGDILSFAERAVDHALKLGPILACLRRLAATQRDRSRM